jgi:hypothetical protein
MMKVGRLLSALDASAVVAVGAPTGTAAIELRAHYSSANPCPLYVKSLPSMKRGLAKAARSGAPDTK